MDRVVSMLEHLDISLKKDPAEVRRVVETVEAFCAKHNLPQQLIFHFNLALDELLTNVMNYGYDQIATDDYDVSVHLVLDQGTLTAELRDNGRAFNPLDMPDPDLSLSLEDKPIGGLGIYFVKTLMDHVEYHREGAYNRLVMSKAIDS